MPRRAPLIALLGSVVLPGGCFTEAPILMPVFETSPGTDSTGVTMAGSSTSTGGADETQGDELATSTSEGSTSEADDSTSSSSGPDPVTGTDTEACEPTEPDTLLWAEDALVLPPMELREAIYLPGKPQMARSLLAEMGSVTFGFELECASTVTIFGLVWDIAQGTQPDNSDSFLVSVDGQPEELWEYGCQTEGLGDMAWAWLPLEAAGPMDCSPTMMSFELEAGTHELTLRNREQGVGEDFAAIAALVVTDDPSFDPVTLYDPAG
ncbi:MAG: hypothetical protein AAF799_37445 [Myxococcota bacterium]